MIGACQFRIKCLVRDRIDPSLSKTRVLIGPHKRLEKDADGACEKVI